MQKISVTHGVIVKSQSRDLDGNIKVFVLLIKMEGRL